jgi:hypothetical protein
MTTSFLIVSAIAFSACTILWLCVRDPKRRRTAGLTGRASAARGTSSTAYQTGCAMPVLAAVAPGVLLLLLGTAAPALLWLGGCAVAGWIITLAASRW